MSCGGDNGECVIVVHIQSDSERERGVANTVGDCFVINVLLPEMNGWNKSDAEEKKKKL